VEAVGVFRSAAMKGIVQHILNKKIAILVRPHLDALKNIRL
jgi:hypothetical protein